MKKTVLVLGCLLAIGFSSVSCNRDDGMPETVLVDTTIQRSDLPKRADHLIASMLGEQIYDATFTNKNVANPFSASEVYTGVTVTSVTKLATANADNGAVYQVVLSNGIELGFKQDGTWAYVDGKTNVLKYSVWNYLPAPVNAAIRASANSITNIVKIEISTADVYTITFQGGAVAKYNADGTAA
jgi:lipoprotein